MPFATDEEIKIAHDILLNDKKPFDITKLNIIKENNSCYVQACRKHSKKCTFYTLRFGCSFAAVNTIKPQLL